VAVDSENVIGLLLVLMSLMLSANAACTRLINTNTTLDSDAGGESGLKHS